MALFKAAAGVQTATWAVTQTPPVGPQSQRTAKFTYDPSQVPPNVIGGRGTMTGEGASDPFTWVFANNVLTWQLTNQSAVQTNTTYFGTFDGVKTVTGSYCNYQIGFVLGGMTAVYQGQ